MDQNHPRPLSAEELAAVDKAMADFANTPQKKKRLAAKHSPPPKPVLHVCPAVRTVLTASILLILAVSLLMLVLWPEPAEPSVAVPTLTYPTETLSEPTNDSTDPTEFPTEPLVPPETEPPTEPPVVIPDGTPLSSDEIMQLQEMFHPGSVYASVSDCSFTQPNTLNLSVIVVSQVDRDYQITDEERTYLGNIYEDFLYLDVYSISRSKAEQIVTQYFGLTLDDIPSAKDAAYWEQTDRFYFIAEATGRQLTITHAVTLPGGNIWVRYTVTQTGNVCEMVLSQAGEYHILTNMHFQDAVFYPLA